ncbi:MAG: ATP phosphoribosyltransferase regulatory subunit [Chloroflexaceae bacterium]|nr:ATP phosphoribosyltransferase regulatory subunit [Chloroflexaceae bacterium]
MSTSIIEAVRGMRDVFSQEQQAMTLAQRQLESLLTSYGYVPIDSPVIEHRDLYLRKIGEDLVGKIYEFAFGGRDLALRPEWTASVLRAYVTHMQEHPLPLRLSYCGPVFRYQRPQRLTYRQFTQAGVELIGAAAPRADAEMVDLACAGLDALGVSGYQILLGHIGVVREALTHLDLAKRTQGMLVWNLERIRSRGPEWVRDQLYETMGDLPIDPSLLEGLDEEQATTLLLRIVQAMGVNLAFGTRSPEEIVGRLVRKLRRKDSRERIDHALDLLSAVSQIRDTPDRALSQAMRLFERAGIELAAFREIRAILTMLEYHGLPQERMVLDFGMGRGLQYYTGLIFEMYDPDGVQICGGGRYDDLVQVLGGRQSVPAVGFAYGLERVVAASTTLFPPEAQRREVLVSPMTDTDYAYALEVARTLRARGFVAMVDVRGRSLANNLRNADRRGTPYVAIVGADERARGEVMWRDLHTRQEKRVRLDELRLDR